MVGIAPTLPDPAMRQTRTPTGAQCSSSRFAIGWADGPATMARATSAAARATWVTSASGSVEALTASRRAGTRCGGAGGGVSGPP